MPWLTRESAALRSSSGLNQLLISTTLTVAAGLTVRAPMVKASMCRITSGMRNGAMKPILPDLDACAAAMPARYLPCSVAP